MIRKTQIIIYIHVYLQIYIHIHIFIVYIYTCLLRSNFPGRPQCHRKRHGEGSGGLLFPGGSRFREKYELGPRNPRIENGIHQLNKRRFTPSSI